MDFFNQLYDAAKAGPITLIASSDTKEGNLTVVVIPPKSKAKPTPQGTSLTGKPGEFAEQFWSASSSYLTVYSDLNTQAAEAAAQLRTTLSLRRGVTEKTPSHLFGRS